MLFTVILLSMFAFIKTIGYAIYEYKENSNTIGAVVISILSIITLIAPVIITII